MGTAVTLFLKKIAGNSTVILKFHLLMIVSLGVSFLWSHWCSSTFILILVRSFMFREWRSSICSSISLQPANHTSSIGVSPEKAASSKVWSEPVWPSPLLPPALSVLLIPLWALPTMLHCMGLDPGLLEELGREKNLPPVLPDPLLPEAEWGQEAFPAPAVPGCSTLAHGLRLVGKLGRPSLCHPHAC